MKYYYLIVGGHLAEYKYYNLYYIVENVKNLSNNELE